MSLDGETGNGDGHREAGRSPVGVASPGGGNDAKISDIDPERGRFSLARIWSVLCFPAKRSSTYESLSLSLLPHT